MRKIILLLAVVCLSKMLFAQSENHPVIPQATLSSFSARYPGETVQQWKPVKNGYTAKFVRDGKKHVAYFSAEGDWVKTERKIKWTRNLPASVKKGWEKTGYAHWYVEKMHEVNSPGEQVYVMSVNNTPTLPAERHSFSEAHKLYFNTSGDLIKREISE